MIWVDLFLISQEEEQGDSLSKKAENQRGLQQLPRWICTDFQRPARRRSKLVERGVAHTPEVQE